MDIWTHPAAFSHYPPTITPGKGNARAGHFILSVRPQLRLWQSHPHDSVGPLEAGDRYLRQRSPLRLASSPLPPVFLLLPRFPRPALRFPLFPLSRMVPRPRPCERLRCPNLNHSIRASRLPLLGAEHAPHPRTAPCGVHYNAAPTTLPSPATPHHTPPIYELELLTPTGLPPRS